MLLLLHSCFCVIILITGSIISTSSGTTYKTREPSEWMMWRKTAASCSFPFIIIERTQPITAAAA